MFWIWVLLAVTQCALLYILARKGESLPALAQRDARANEDIPEAQWPSVGLVIPVAGCDARMEDALRSLLGQDYPRFTPVLVTAQADDPAVELIMRLQKEFPLLRHVTSGAASGCGQKNHNSLCGVEALGNAVDIYAFCDSTHIAEADFLRHLVGPLARGEASFSTGYHMVVPQDQQRVTLAYALCVILMRMLQAMSSFTQLWGGAMAMTRSAWHKYGVGQLWGENVVDDCSLSALLKVHGEAVCLCPGALLRTSAVDHNMSVWRAWMDRQVLFLKFCMPDQWLLLGVMCLMMAVPLLCATVCLLGGLLRLGSATGVLLSVFWLAGIVGVLNLWRGLLSKPVALWQWCLAFIEAVRMFTLVYLQSIRAQGILWHGLYYDIGRGGKVLHIHRA